MVRTSPFGRLQRAGWLMSADDHAAAALKLARKKQAGGDDAGAMKMAQKSLRILESDEASGARTARRAGATSRPPILRGAIRSAR